MNDRRGSPPRRSFSERRVGVGEETTLLEHLWGDGGESPYDTLLVRYGELALKGKNRRDFERVLHAHVRRALEGLAPVRIRRTFGRMYIHGPEPVLVEAARRLERVFGIFSFSLARRAENDLEAIRAAALAVLRAEVARRPGVRTFKVSARRTDPRFPLRVPELLPAIGGYLLPRSGGLRVDVNHPDLEIAVEIRPEGTYVYTARIPGPGGLPLGTNGKALLLLSGGIDSPVAGWYVMRRGVRIEAVHFHSPPYTKPEAKDKVLALGRILAAWSDEFRVHFVSLTEILLALRDAIPEALRTVILRRFMMRIATELARERRALAIVTGESLGQVASQTLEALAAIEDAAELPVLRPLVGLDKTEIIDRARKIGTYETSVLPCEDTCTLFLPRHPKTRPRLVEVRAVEERSGLDISGLVVRALATVESVTLQADVGGERAAGALSSDPTVEDDEGLSFYL
ncbi:MAG: tRNA 4-thiouridine(8) synthase ThiI [Brockia lithotrophica]|nr:tRNA 4-thiouridine(8) synthase ThiI [Brockia lithotrophica]